MKRMGTVALLLAGMMLGAGLGAILMRPTQKLAHERAAISLENSIPKQFGEWREERQPVIQLVNPQTQELLDRLYSEILTRVYVNDSGYRIMLSLAYGSDQRGALQAHKPEICYPAQGFAVRANLTGVIETAFGRIPVRRLSTSRGARQEPVTYWFTVGDRAVRGGTQKRISELMYGLTGRIPDGMIARISSIDADTARAYREQESFVADLVRALPPEGRRRLSGLGEL